MKAFTLATLVPVGLLAAAAIWGGIFPALAFIWMTFLLAVLDWAFQGARDNAPPGAEFPAAASLSTALALAHLALLALTIWALGTDRVNGIPAILLFLSAGLFFGQISNANAHELIHASARTPRLLGQTVYCTLLFGHHASSHLKVHHTYVATKTDPNTARLGESFWRYLPRAWAGSFRAGLAAETELRAKSGHGGLHPYAAYALGSAVTVLVASLIGGLTGVLWLLALAGTAQSQLLLSDYVQHYGLVRRTDPNGRLEPVREQHSWNAPLPASSAMLLNAPRHSDHHAHPARAYPALQYESSQPTLPLSLPLMAFIALMPSVWRRMMDPRVMAVMGPAA